MAYEYPNKMKSEVIEEKLRELSKEKRRVSNRLLNLKRKEAELANKVSSLEDEIAFWRTILGKRKGEKCKARQETFISYVETYHCLLKRRYFHSQEDMYRLLCSHCRLSKEQIETGCLFYRITGEKDG